MFPEVGLYKQTQTTQAFVSNFKAITIIFEKQESENNHMPAMSCGTRFYIEIHHHKMHLPTMSTSGSKSDNAVGKSKSRNIWSHVTALAGRKLTSQA